MDQKPRFGRRAEDDLDRPRTLGQRLRAYFFAGVLVLAPISITFYIAYLILDFIDSHVTPLIPPRFNPETYLPFTIPGFGLVTVVVITLVGAATANYLGRFFFRLSERLLVRMPIIRSIYGAVKQLVEAVFARKANAFRNVVLVEWPRAGVWTLGFVTADTAEQIQRRLPLEACSVMVPTTPNPTSGYLIFVPKDSVIQLEMSVEDAMKMILSSGIVVPGPPVAAEDRAAPAEATERTALT